VLPRSASSHPPRPFGIYARCQRIVIFRDRKVLKSIKLIDNLYIRPKLTPVAAEGLQ
jgi:hypothetical protein